MMSTLWGYPQSHDFLLEKKGDIVVPLVIEQFAMDMATYFNDLQMKMVNFHS